MNSNSLVDATDLMRLMKINEIFGLLWYAYHGHFIIIILQYTVNACRMMWTKMMCRMNFPAFYGQWQQKTIELRWKIKLKKIAVRNKNWVISYDWNRVHFLFVQRKFQIKHNNSNSLTIQQRAIEFVKKMLPFDMQIDISKKFNVNVLF